MFCTDAPVSAAVAFTLPSVAAEICSAYAFPSEKYTPVALPVAMLTRVSEPTSQVISPPESALGASCLPPQPVAAMPVMTSTAKAPAYLMSVSSCQ